MMRPAQSAPSADIIQGFWKSMQSWGREFIPTSDMTKANKDLAQDERV
jgi:hypothetical protein